MTDRNEDDRLLERLDEALAAESLRATADDDPELREAMELMGLLAYELEPVPPHPRVKAEIFERLGLEPVADSTAPETSDSSPPALGDRLVRRSAEPTNRWQSTPTWLVTLAAASVLLAVALALFSGALLGRLREQNREVARLADRVDRLEQLGEVDRLRAELALARERLEVVTSPTAEVCALSPRSPAQPEARGAVFMNRRSGEWVLAAENLAPAPSGRVYSLWFDTEQGAVRGGTFRVDEATRRIEISSDALPDGTRAILITLEPEDSREPGETVLFGDEARHIL